MEYGVAVLIPHGNIEGGRIISTTIWRNDCRTVRHTRANLIHGSNDRVFVDANDHGTDTGKFYLIVCANLIGPGACRPIGVHRHVDAQILTVESVSIRRALLNINVPTPGGGEVAVSTPGATISVVISRVVRGGGTAIIHPCISLVGKAPREGPAGGTPRPAIRVPLPTAVTVARWRKRCRDEGFDVPSGAEGRHNGVKPLNGVCVVTLIAVERKTDVHRGTAGVDRPLVTWVES